MAFTGADEQRSRQVLQARRGSLEHRQRAEIHRGRVDVLAGKQLRGDVGGCPPNAGVLDVDELTLVGLQRVARVELREAVRAHDLPVGATRQHLAAYAGTFEGPAE